MVPGLSDEAIGTGDPTGLEAELIGLAGSKAGNVNLDPVRPIVTMPVGSQVKFTILERAQVVGSLGQPATRAGSIRCHGGSIDDQIRSRPILPDLDIS